MRLRFLFGDDPLAILDVADNFSTWYNLEIQYQEILAIAERLYEAEQARQERLRSRSAQWGENEEGNTRPAMTPAQLHRLEEFLKSADLSSFVRRQQVCAVTAEARPKRILKEIYVSIDELAATVLPEANLAANRWLFQHFTMTLDRRILKLLTRAEDRDLHSSFSMNLNVATLLSPEFLQFDSELRMGGRGTIVIELQLVDIFADVSDFFFARDYLSEKGYRLCIDGVTHHSLPLVDRKALGTDLVKVLWSPAFIDDSPDDGKRDRIHEAIERCGKSRIILAHCDTEEAVRFGHQLGITMFQGRFLDGLMQEETRFGMTSFQL
jgi:EAL domain-containing protein (putative c-di-GMP-specific phosphodiesterase class I)